MASAKRFHPGYGPLIMQDCGCTREECPDVEQIMRDMNGGLLDALSKTEFVSLAKEAYEHYRRENATSMK